MTDHKVGTREEWLAARERLLVREKEHTRLGDGLAPHDANCRGCESSRSTASTRTTVSPGEGRRAITVDQWSHSSVVSCHCK
jgi:Bacterial protein of unknown function (DUF899)